MVYQLIFSIRWCARREIAKKNSKVWALIYALFCSQVVPEKHGGLMATGSKVLLGIFSSSKIRYHIWRFAEKRMTKYSFGSTPYVTELCVGPRYMGNIYH